jgi:hypothetical protein
VSDVLDSLQKGEVTIQVLVILNVALFESQNVLEGSNSHPVYIDASQIAVLTRVQEVDALGKIGTRFLGKDTPHFNL